MFVIYAFTLYSFEVNGVSEVIKTKESEDPKALSLVFNRIFTIRLVIFLFFLVAILIAGLFIDIILFQLLLAWMLYPLSFIFQNTYFFLAKEDNFSLALFAASSRVLAVLGIIYFINENSESYLVPLIIGLIFLAGGVCSFLVILVKYNVKLMRVSRLEIKNTLILGKDIFFGNISVLMLKDLNVIILGLLLVNPVAISTYSIAEKIIKSFQAAIRPLNSFFFPKGIKLLGHLKKPDSEALKIINKITTPQYAVLAFFSIIFFVLAFAFGEKLPILRDIDNLNAVLDLCLIMIAAVFFGVSNYMYGTLGLNHLDKKKYYAKSIFITGLISVSISFIIIKLHNETGAAISFVFAEALLLFFILKSFLSKKTTL
jgi:O-antigen/teichoic acid export membrane protein